MHAATARKLARCTTAVGAAVSAHEAFASFAEPYYLSSPTSYGSLTWTNAAGIKDDWSYTLEGYAGYRRATYSDNRTANRAYFTVSSSALTTTLSVFTTAVPGYLDLSFDYVAPSTADRVNWFYIRDGVTTTTSLTGAGTYAFSAEEGDVFGFKLSAVYSSYDSQLTVTHFAAVPEPASVAGWMGAGAAGLVAMRALRRRRRAAA
jgi:hypothetical protein